jgi:hypothetical protein
MTLKCQLYGLSHDESAQLNDFIEENLCTG